VPDADKESEKILKSWDDKRSRFVKLAMDLYDWLNKHTHGTHAGPTQPPPEVIVVSSGPPARSAADILLHPSEPHFVPVEKK
jgi:hypothetical protein